MNTWLRLADSGAVADSSTSTTVLHTVAGVATGTSIIGALGYIAPFFAVLAGLTASIMYIITIWESRTVRHWWNNRSMRRAARRIAGLKAKQKILTTELEVMEKLREARADARERIEMAKLEADVETKSRPPV